MNTKQVAERLESVIDPELGIDIVSLGLIYDIDIEDRLITVRMTMTTPNCPMAAALLGMSGQVLDRSFEDTDVVIEHVNDPPWNVQMANEQALRWLGLLPA